MRRCLTDLERAKVWGATRVGPVTLTTGMDEAVSQLEAGSIDAAEFAGGFPFRPVSDAARRYGIQLLEFDDQQARSTRRTVPRRRYRCTTAASRYYRERELFR